MPTILLVKGWRFFFFFNEGNEPMHIHAEKGGAVAKYWLYSRGKRIDLAYFHRGTPQQKREVYEIISQHFDLLEEEWNKYHR